MTEGTSPGGPSKTSLRLTTAACILGLIGILFSLIHFIRPGALTFALFMIVGQGSFGLALIAYAGAVVRDLKKRKVL